MTADYGSQHASRYARGRSLSDQTMHTWGELVRRQLPRPPRLLLDLGAGTGRFASGLAAQLGCEVLAVEPSAAMLAHAPHTPRVHLLRARAERLPVATGSCDAVWASQVVHHLTDLDAAAAEIARVLRPDGRLLVRGNFGQTVQALAWLPWFPEARAVAQEYFDLGRLEAAFARHGLRQVANELVRQMIAASLRELHQRTRERADSILAALPDESFARGLARLDADARREAYPQPVVEGVDLLTYQPTRFRRP